MARRYQILHPTDFSRASNAALAVARSLATRNNGELLIVHVLVPPRVLYEVTNLSPRTSKLLMDEARNRARRRLSVLMKELSGKRLHAKSRLLEGVPYLLIPQVARKARVDMIAMGTHRRRGAAGLLLGSVAARVLRLAPCPVLTVRA